MTKHYPTWAPPELEEHLEDETLLPKFKEIIRKLTIDVKQEQHIYAKAFWKELKSRSKHNNNYAKHVIGKLFMACGGNADTISNKKTRHAEIVDTAKNLSRLLKNKTTLNLVKLDSLDPDYIEGIVLTPNDGGCSFFNLSDVLDELVTRVNEIDLSEDMYAVKTGTNINRDSFIQTLGDYFFKEYGQYLYGTIGNAYRLIYNEEISNKVIEGRLKRKFNIQIK